MNRRRLTEDEWEAELRRAKAVQAADLARHPVGLPAVVRTPRKRSRWARPWARR